MPDELPAIGHDTRRGSGGVGFRAQLKIASGERRSAESVAGATDPPNLIRLVPAKEAGPSTR